MKALLEIEHCVLLLSFFASSGKHPDKSDFFDSRLTLKTISMKTLLAS